MTYTNKPKLPALGVPVDHTVERQLPERADSDAPICLWCDQQRWDECQHADDARTYGGER